MTNDSDFSDIVVFKTSQGDVITYERLLSDIYENTNETRNTIREIIDQLVSVISSPKDAVLVMTHISEMMEARVKNDDLMVKIAAIVARIIQKKMSAMDGDNPWDLSEEEKRQLLADAEEVLDRSV